MPVTVLDAAGRPRSPATMPGFHAGRPPRNKGQRYPADPPRVEEIVATMRRAGDDVFGLRLQALIALMWRAGLRISEALALNEGDLDLDRGAVLVRRGKGGHRREVGMDEWGWQHLRPWQQARLELPVGALLCIIHGPTSGRAWSPSGARTRLRRTAAAAGVPAASPRTNSVMRTRWRWPGRASHSTSFSASSVTPTSASPPSTSKASTPPRSSTPSTPDRHQCSPPAAPGASQRASRDPPERAGRRADGCAPWRSRPVSTPAAAARSALHQPYKHRTL